MKAIGIDFDGVIHSYDRGWHDGSIYGGFKPGALCALLELLDGPYAVFVHTTRKPGPVARWIERQSGHTIECLTPWQWWLTQTGKRVFWNTTGLLLVTNRKLPAVVYLDDRAVRFNDWGTALTTIKAILE